MESDMARDVGKKKGFWRRREEKMGLLLGIKWWFEENGFISVVGWNGENEVCCVQKSRGEIGFDDDKRGKDEFAVWKKKIIRRKWIFLFVCLDEMVFLFWVFF